MVIGQEGMIFQKRRIAHIVPTLRMQMAFVARSKLAITIFLKLAMETRCLLQLKQHG